MASETNVKLSNVTSTKKNGDFDDHAFLSFAGMARTIVKFESKDTLFTQGAACEDVMYIQGRKLAEGALTGQPLRTATATAVTPTTLFMIGLKEMVRVLHSDHTSLRSLPQLLIGAQSPD